jgi:hypothetical protein
MATPLPPLLDIPVISFGPPLPSESAKFSPKVRSSQLRRIGVVAVYWARLESCLNDLTWTVQGKNLVTGRTLTEDLDITRLLNALQNAMQTHLIGQKFSNERRSITNLITFVNATKHERNIVVHGTWAELNGNPVVGSLRSDTPHPSLVTFESCPWHRLDEIASYAIDAISVAKTLTSRLESLQQIPSPQPRQVPHKNP